MLSWYKEEDTLTNDITCVEYFFNSNDDSFCPDTINSLVTDARKDGMVPDFIEGTKEDLRRLMHNQTMERYPKVFASVNGPFKLVQTLDKEEPTIIVSFKVNKGIKEKRVANLNKGLGKWLGNFVKIKVDKGTLKAYNEGTL